MSLLLEEKVFEHLEQVVFFFLRFCVDIELLVWSTELVFGLRVFAKVVVEKFIIIK